jgi:hypothetical protein
MSATEEMLSGTADVFVRVIVCAALVVFTVCAAKVNVETLAVTVGSTPVPDKVTPWGEPAALSVKFSVAEKTLVEVGVNVTGIVQAAPGARTAQVVAPLSEKPAPAIKTVPTVSGARPVFVRVTD